MSASPSLLSGGRRLAWPARRRRALLIAVVAAGLALGSRGANAIALNDRLPQNAIPARTSTAAASENAALQAEAVDTPNDRATGAPDRRRRDAGPPQGRPWTMQTPWPKGSPAWYPDTVVQMVVWFTKNGEGLHDASWQPAATPGPGSQFGPFASHACIHVPLAAVRTLFEWAPIGTPVVVYPGDGSPASSQALQQSVDPMGNPVTGLRGA
jgi:hypothetical protein